MALRWFPLPLPLLLLLLSAATLSSASASDSCAPVVDDDDAGSVVRCRLRSATGLATALKLVSDPVRRRVRTLGVECGQPGGVLAGVDDALQMASRTLGVLVPQLDALKIDGCPLADVNGQAFDGLAGLRQLRVQSRPHGADWPPAGAALTLAADVFDGQLAQLHVLDLALNELRLLPPSLCRLRSLQHLNVTGNRLQDLNWLVPTDETETCLSELRVLDASYNRLTALHAGVLHRLQRLQQLHLQGNWLVQVADNALDGLVSLRLLNVAGNQLTSLPPALLAQTRQLQELYASANSLAVLAPGLLHGLDDLLVIDLSDNQLTSASLSGSQQTLHGLRHLAVLSLHNNRIQRLDAALLQDLTALQILRLDGNLIEALPDGLLDGLAALHTLILSRNRLTALQAGAVAGLQRLALLALDNNLLERVDDQALANCTALRDLNLSGNYLAQVPAALRGLTRLQSLDLGENRIQGFDADLLQGMDQLSSLRLLDNHVGNISRSTFAHLPALKILNLSKNSIGHVEASALSHNRLLQAVRLDQNELTDISGLFRDLPHLVWLNMSDNRLEHFDYGHIPTSLQWLDLHANRIDELGNYYQLDDQLALQTLDASFNRLTELTASMLPDSLQVLSLNDNLISQVQPYTFFRKDNLTRVDLYANQIRELDQNALRISPLAATSTTPPEFYMGGNPFQCDCNMEWLQRINTADHLRQHPRVADLESIYCRLPHSRQKSYIPLVEASASHFVCSYETHCFALCHCCDFYACDCKMTCPQNCTCYHDQSWSANVVDCRAAVDEHLPERIPMDVTELYLDGSRLRSLASHKFIGRKNLRLLFLNSSGVEVIHNRTFNGLKGLQVLHLEDNRIRQLNGVEFQDLESLRRLYLHNNELHSIRNGTFAPLKHLEVLRLDGNRLVDLHLWNLLVQAPYLNQLHLSANPWSCDCAYLDGFRAALLLAGAKIADAGALLCVSNDVAVAQGTLPVLAITSKSDEDGAASNASSTSTSVSAGALCLSSASPSATTIVQQRVIDDYLPLLVTTLCAFLVVTLLVLVAFVYRYQMRVFCHARYGVRLWGKSDSVLDQGKLFDAFVSYSGKDDAFVQQMLATNLEYGSPSYKLCLQHRDCPSAGAYGLSETIGQAVEASKRTIMVISPNFMKAEWCRFEYKSALHQLFKNRRNKCLVVILIGDIPQKDLDPDLKLYLKTNTYLQWGELRFWDKLRYALPDVSPSSSTSSTSTASSTSSSSSAAAVQPSAPNPLPIRSVQPLNPHPIRGPHGPPRPPCHLPSHHQLHPLSLA